MAIRTQNKYSRPVPKPQSVVSVTIPDQAPQLRYILAAMATGDIPRVQQSALYDRDPTLDDLDLRNYDMRHMRPEDIDRLLPPTPPTPPTE